MQLVTMVVRVEEVGEKEEVAQRPRIRHQVEVAKLSLFNREVE